MTSSVDTSRAALKGVLQRLLPAAVLAALLRAWQRMYWWNRARPRVAHNRRIAQRLVADGVPIKLELGSARREGMNGWTFSDLGGGGDIALDFTRPLPFPDQSVECLYSSHVLEHFSYPQPMLDFLRECHRVLRRGGSYRLAVPDARIYIDGYNNPQDFDVVRWCTHDTGLSLKTPIDYVNFIAYMGGDHKHLFDDQNLLLVLREAGFREVSLREFDPAIDLALRRHESLYAIAVK